MARRKTELMNLMMLSAVCLTAGCTIVPTACRGVPSVMVTGDSFLMLSPH